MVCHNHGHADEVATMSADGRVAWATATQQVRGGKGARGRKQGKATFSRDVCKPVRNGNQAPQSKRAPSGNGKQVPQSERVCQSFEPCPAGADKQFCEAPQDGYGFMRFGSCESGFVVCGG